MASSPTVPRCGHQPNPRRCYSYAQECTLPLGHTGQHRHEWKANADALRQARIEAAVEEVRNVR